MFSASFESFTCQTHSLALPVENAELKCKQECIQVPSAAVAISGGGGSSEREVSAEGGVLLGGGGFAQAGRCLSGCVVYTFPILWTDRQLFKHYLSATTVANSKTHRK